MKLPSISILLLLSVCLPTYGQQKNTYEQEKADNQKLTLKLIGAVIKTPVGYAELPGEAEVFDCSPSKMGSSPSYNFISKDRKVVISVALLPRDSNDYRSSAVTMQSYRPDWKAYHPDSVWRYNFKNYADTIHYSYNYWGKKDLAYYNADEGVTFQMSCKGLFLKDYNIARAVILNKKFQGIIHIYYFLKQGERLDVAAEIKKNSGFVTFMNKY